MKLSFKLASDLDGSSRQGLKDHMAPLSAFDQKGTGPDHTADRLRAWGVDPRTWTRYKELDPKAEEAPVGQLCAQLRPSGLPQPATLCGGPGRREDGGLCQVSFCKPLDLRYSNVRADGLRARLLPGSDTPQAAALASELHLESWFLCPSVDHLKNVRPAAGFSLSKNTFPV